MSCGKCKSCVPLCPVSFGLALGLTGAIISFVMIIYMMYYGVPPRMEGMVDVSFHGAFVKALWMLLKGFVFGFIFALIYDFIACYCKKYCCKKSDESCECGNGKAVNGKK